MTEGWIKSPGGVYERWKRRWYDEYGQALCGPYTLYEIDDIGIDPDQSRDDPSTCKRCIRCLEKKRKGGK